MSPQSSARATAVRRGTCVLPGIAASPRSITPHCRCTRNRGPRSGGDLCNRLSFLLGRSLRHSRSRSGLNLGARHSRSRSRGDLGDSLSFLLDGGLRHRGSRSGLNLSNGLSLFLSHCRSLLLGLGLRNGRSRRGLDLGDSLRLLLDRGLCDSRSWKTKLAVFDLTLEDV